MDKPTTTPPARPVVRKPPTAPVTKIRQVKGVHVLDHKDDVFHAGSTGTRGTERSVTSL